MAEQFDPKRDRFMSPPSERQVGRASERQPGRASLSLAAVDGEPLAPVSRGQVPALFQGATREQLLALWDILREDLASHGGEWTRPGFQALAVYRFGVWRMGIKPKLVRAPLSVLWRTLFEFCRNFYGIELPYSASIGRRVVFEHQHGIVVHGDTVIGDDCIIRQGVTLGIRRLTRKHDAPILGRGVNVGAGAKILGKLRIGDHAEIGANAVVLEDVPAGALAAGVPARIRNRDGSPALRVKNGDGARSSRRAPRAEA